MIEINEQLTPSDFPPLIAPLWELAGPKIRSIHQRYGLADGAPVFTIRGSYTSQGWTEWTQGFQFGAAILLFDATNDQFFLDLGRDSTVQHMAPHISHFGVHDHGFNNISTYGNLFRLMSEGRIPHNNWEHEYYALALKISGAVQAERWTATADGGGFIYSFNGPHSLFSDTIRSLRSLGVAHQLGHFGLGENDQRVNLLERLVVHALTTTKYNVYYGEHRDAYDQPGRVVHESIFNINDGNYRCPSTQQGYSPYTTWTRGLAWIMTGCAEQLEFLHHVTDAELNDIGGRDVVEAALIRAATATCDFYIANSPTDGIPYWDTGAPGLAHLGDYQDRPSDPFNTYEPIDSSAAAIAVQGLLRFGRYLLQIGNESGNKYWQAGLTTLRSLLNEPYLSFNPEHEGLLLHSIYHQPRGWDHVPVDDQVAHGEACMWGDYHLLETCLYIQRIATDAPYLTFFHHE